MFGIKKKRKIEKVLITGGTGLLGRALVNYLLEEGLDVTVVGHPGSNRFWLLPLNHPRFHLCMKDISEISSIQEDKMTATDVKLSEDDAYEKIVTEAMWHVHLNSFDAIYHLAWMGTVGTDRQDEALQRKNLDAFEEVFRLGQKVGAKVIVFAGSQAEYGIQEGVTSENAEMKPVNFYGKIKKEAEEKGRELSKKYGIDFVTGRIFSVYGPNDRSGSMLSMLIRNLSSGMETDLTDGTQKWDYLYETDAADALYRLGKYGKTNEAYNISAGDVRPLRYYVEEVRAIVNPEGVLNFGKVKTDGHLASLNPDISKLKKHTGFRPRVPFSEGIQKIVSSMK